MPTSEAQAREKIDEQLIASGWLIQDYKGLNLGAGKGIAVREVLLKTGPCDCLLLVNRITSVSSKPRNSPPTKKT